MRRPVPSHNRSPADSTDTSGPADRADRAEDTPTLPIPRTRPLTEDIPTVPMMPVRRAAEAATLSLAPVELEAIVQAAQAAMTPASIDVGARTVESVRLAQGSSELPVITPPARTGGRGPRRSRETLRADEIRRDPAAPTPPVRKP